MKNTHTSQVKSVSQMLQDHIGKFAAEHCLDYQVTGIGVTREEDRIKIRIEVEVKDAKV